MLASKTQTPPGNTTYFKEALNVLKHKHAAVTEVGLLRHFGTATSHTFDHVAWSAFLQVPFHLQVPVTKHHVVTQLYQHTTVHKHIPVTHTMLHTSHVITQLHQHTAVHIHIAVTHTACHHITAVHIPATNTTCCTQLMSSHNCINTLQYRNTYLSHTSSNKCINTLQYTYT